MRLRQAQPGGRETYHSHRNGTVFHAGTDDLSPRGASQQKALWKDRPQALDGGGM